jgi:hypothetical protein
MKRRVEKPMVKRAPAKGRAQGARFPRRDQIKTGEGPALPLEKLLHDTYARRACHLL